MIKKIFQGGSACLVAILIGIVGSLLRSALAIRFLSTDEAGIWFLLLNVITITGFCDFGLSPTLSREIGFACKKANPALRISNLFFTIRRVISFVSIFTLLFLVAFGYFYFRHLPLNADLMKQVTYDFALFVIGIILQFQTNPYLAILYGMGNIATERYIRALPSIFGIIISFWLVLKLHLGLNGLVIGYLSQTIIMYSITKYLFHRNTVLTPKGRYLPIVFKRILRPSIQWAIMTIGAALIFQISNFIIGYLSGVQCVAQFAIPFQISMFLLSAANIVGYIITPFVSQAKGKNDFGKIFYFLSLTVRATMGTTIILAIFSYLYIDSISSLWLSNSFVVNKNVLLTLLITVVLEAQHVACAAVALASGYIKFAVIAVTSGILNVIFSFIFISKLGILGAALSIMISQLLTNNWYVVLMSLRYLQIPLKKYFAEILLPTLLLGAYSYLIIYFVHGITFKNIYTLLSVHGLIILTLCLGGSWFLLLNNAEKTFIKLKILKITGMI